MQHVKDYIAKLESLIAQRKQKKTTKSTGLLGSNRTEKPDEKVSELSIIANYIVGIRKAKEEMKNGK